MKSFFSFINEAVESGLRDSDYNPDWHEPEWVKTHKPSVVGTHTSNDGDWSKTCAKNRRLLVSIRT